MKVHPWSHQWSQAWPGEKPGQSLERITLTFPDRSKNPAGFQRNLPGDRAGIPGFSNNF